MCDIEQLVVTGKQMKACPYYGSRYAIPSAQVRYRTFSLAVNCLIGDKNFANIILPILLICTSFFALLKIFHRVCKRKNLEKDNYRFRSAT